VNHVMDRSLNMAHRLPPCNIQAEQALLGALLANNKAYDRIVGVVSAEHFADPVNGKIFAVASEIIENGGLADAVTLKSRFSERGTLEDVGGTQYLTQLLTAMVGIIGVGEYAKVIRETWLRRQMIGMGEDLVNSAFASDPDVTPTQLLDRVTDDLGGLYAHGTTAKRSGTTVLQAINKALEEGPSGVALSTGMPSLDRISLRLRPGTLMCIGARPGMGKTALARSLAINVALGLGVTADGEIIDDQSLGRSVCYCALEENDADFGAAALAQLSDVSINDVLTGAFRTDTEMADRIVRATRRYAMAEENLHIFDQPRQSLRMITQQSRAVQRKMKGDLRLVIVDYLQLMPDHPSQKEKRLAVGQNAYGLKDLAKELGCCVVMLSQLSRGVDSRSDHRPTLSDLRESGEIEDACDVVLFPYREAYYFGQTRPVFDPSSPPAAYKQALNEWQAKFDELSKHAEIAAAKVRRGRANAFCRLLFRDTAVRFEEPQP
jgi:replicative DNA helicase